MQNASSQRPKRLGVRGAANVPPSLLTPFAKAKSQDCRGSGAADVPPCASNSAYQATPELTAAYNTPTGQCEQCVCEKSRLLVVPTAAPASHSRDGRPTRQHAINIQSPINGGLLYFHIGLLRSGGGVDG